MISRLCQYSVRRAPFATALTALFLTACVLLLAACSSDGYNTGEGPLSNLTSELVEAHCVTAGQIDYVLTDDDRRLTLDAPFAASWAKEDQTYYRGLLYYQPLTDGTVRVHRLTQLTVLTPQPADELDDLTTDPLTIESAWLSANKRYLNLRMQVKTGESDGNTRLQTLGLLLLDSTDSEVTLQLLHGQNEVPQYYSATVFCSIPTAQYAAGTTIRLRVNTYQGPIERTFQL